MTWKMGPSMESVSEIGCLQVGDRVALILGSTRTEMSADAARAVATLLLTCADMVDGTVPDDDDDETTGRGDA